MSDSPYRLIIILLHLSREIARRVGVSSSLVHMECSSGPVLGSSAVEQETPMWNKFLGKHRRWDHKWGLMGPGEREGGPRAAAAVSNKFIRLAFWAQYGEACFNSEFCIFVKNTPKGKPVLKTLSACLL